VGFNVKEIYVYEVVSETHWNPAYLEPGFLPNVWVDISTTIDIKMKALECYKSQMQAPPHFRSFEAVQALAKLRGSQMSMSFAEAFVLIRKLT
jgi:N-acetylglucosamine malate deacetylase 1